MSDLTAYSDADLMASLPVGVRNNNPLNLKGADGSFMSFPTADAGKAAADQNLFAYGTKHGINTVAGVTSRWAPKGDGANDPAAYAAYIAQRTGIAPNQTIDLTDTPTRQALLGAMSEYETGQQKKGRDLSSISDSDLLASIPRAQGTAAPKAPAAIPQGPVQVASRPPPAVKPSLLADIAHGAGLGLREGITSPLDTIAHKFTDPVQDLSNMTNYLVSKVTGRPPAQIHLPTVNGIAAQVAPVPAPQTVPGQYARTIGQFAPAAMAPGSVPARVANVVLPAVASETAGQVAHRIGASPLVEQLARTGGAVLGGAAANMRLSPSEAPAGLPRSIDDVKAASDAAWRKLDASDFKVPRAQVQAAADTMQAALNEAGPELYTDAPKILARAQQMAGRDDVTVAQLNRLRSQIGNKLLSPNSTEPDMGQAFRGAVDDVILNSGDPNVAPARDLYARWKKMQAVTDALGSADLQKAGNAAIPGQIKPLINPKSSQRIRNLTPEEQQAMRDIVKGDLLDKMVLQPMSTVRTNGPISGPLVHMLAVPTHGVSEGVGLIGAGAQAISNARTAGKAQQLLDLMSLGGKAPVSSAPKVIGFDPLSDPALIAGLLSRPQSALAPTR